MGEEVRSEVSYKHKSQSKPAIASQSQIQSKLCPPKSDPKPDSKIDYI